MMGAVDPGGAPEEMATGLGPEQPPVGFFKATVFLVIGPAAAGGVIARLLAPGQKSGSGEILLRVGERNDLGAGNLFVHLYTRGNPLGAARAAIKVPVVLAQN